MIWLLAACAGPVDSDEVAPYAASDFYGMWANVEQGTVRVLEFRESAEDADLVGETDVYFVNNYPEGSTPREVQHGTYAIAAGDGWEIVTTATWSSDGQVGVSYGNPIRSFDGTTLVLGVDGGERTYTATSAMP